MHHLALPGPPGTGVAAPPPPPPPQGGAGGVVGVGQLTMSQLNSQIEVITQQMNPTTQPMYQPRLDALKAELVARINRGDFS